jgi:hypothetical protein
MHTPLFIPITDLVLQPAPLVGGGLGDPLGAAEFFVSELDIGCREV